MAKANQITESSMEEILASIRKIITEDESKSDGNFVPLRPEAEPADAPSNVSPLFKAEADSEKPEKSEPSTADQFMPEPMVVSMEPIGEEPDDEEESEPESPLVPIGNSPVGPLLSPQADRAVASAFNQLASTILSNNSRTIEQLAEDMMRPMLKSWLDDNLPSLVERLVREEIERVSRRR